MAQVEESQGEERLEDGVEDGGDVVVGQVDGVEFVEFWERPFRDGGYQVVGDVQDFYSCHVVDGYLYKKH